MGIRAKPSNFSTAFLAPLLRLFKIGSDKFL